MPGISTADAGGILKDVYGDSVHTQLNNEVRALSHFQKSESARWVGRRFVESLRTGRNRATKAVAEKGLLPNAQRQRYANLFIPDRYIYTTIEVTAQFMSEVRDKGAFINGMTAEMDGAIDDLKVEIERMIWGYGSGKLALVNGDIGAAQVLIVPVNTPGGIAGAINGARFIREGMELAFHDANGAAAPLAVRIVDSIAADGTTITLTATVNNVTAPVSGWITKGVSRDGSIEGSASIEPMGLAGIFDDGTFVTVFHGLDRTLNPVFKSNIFTSVGVLDETILHRGMDACDELGGRPNWLACHHSVHREYIRLSQADRRYTGDKLMRPDVGITGGGKKDELQFSGMDIEKHRFAPYSTFYAMDDRDLKRYVNQEGKWVDEDGDVLYRGTGSTDSFKATYRKFSNYSTNRANTSFVLRGITSSIDVVNPS